MPKKWSIVDLLVLLCFVWFLHLYTTSAVERRLIGFQHRLFGMVALSRHYALFPRTVEASHRKNIHCWIWVFYCVLYNVSTVLRSTTLKCMSPRNNAANRERMSIVKSTQLKPCIWKTKREVQVKCSECELLIFFFGGGASSKCSGTTNHVRFFFVLFCGTVISIKNATRTLYVITVSLFLLWIWTCNEHRIPLINPFTSYKILSNLDLRRACFKWFASVIAAFGARCEPRL